MRILIAILFSVQAFAFQLSTEQKLADLNQLIEIVKAQYGPLHYKADKLGIKVDDLAAKYEASIKATTNNKEFYYELIKFVGEFKDGHFGAWIPTKLQGKVPFIVELVDGKVLIDEIDRNKLSESKFPFERGDEVVSINGQSVADFIDEHKLYRGSGADLSARVRAAYMLTRRRGRYVPVWDGEVKYEIRRGTSTVIEDVTLEWEVTGDYLDEFEPTVNKEETNNRSVLVNPELDKISTVDMLEDFYGEDLKWNYHCSGDTRIAIPEDATIIMKKPFVAYYHPTEKGNVGYLRIPHYSPQNEVTKKAEYDLRFSQYEYAVSILEENTEGLIIDQDHNCGGSVYYLERMLGLFMQKAYPPMIFRLIATKAEVMQIADWLVGTNKYTLAHKHLKNIFDLVKETWEKGEFMTKKTNLRGFDEFQPNAITYTKPIVMLIDHQSGSGGDAFPSMMKGLGRATLFGTQTMGLGGHVQNTPALNNSGIQMRITKSLFYKPNGDEVENNGAIPDVPYTITRDDFLYEYKGYQQAYLKALFERM